jgi:DNA-directed RNA polymerase specialized sigma subunit
MPFVNILAEQLWKAVEKALSERDAFIIKSYYKDKLLEQSIADVLGVSQPRVHQLRIRSEQILAIELKDFKNFLS